MRMNAITVSHLTKKYGSLVAVNNVSFDVAGGEVFAILGENGAGKTTTLEMIEGLRRPTSGEITVLGHNVRTELSAVKQKIGVQLQSSAYYKFLTLNEILRLFGGFYEKSLPAVQLLKTVGLESKARSLIGQLSGGQQQRFSIAASLVNDPEIVFLDEPTTGLDPNARRSLWKLITDIKSQGKTIILTTHYLEEAELLADRVAIMDKGKIIALDQTHKLVEQTKIPFVITAHLPKLMATVQTKLQKLGTLTTRGGKEDWYELGVTTQPKLNDALAVIAALKPVSITVKRATLEDLFIELTGKKLAT